MDHRLELHKADGAKSFRVLISGDSSDAADEDGLDVVLGPAGSCSVVGRDGSFEATVTEDDGAILVVIAGERFRFELDSERGGNPNAPSASAGRAEVKAPMPGKVAKLLCVQGETVEAGQGVLLFEAMKMQNEIRSPQRGVIAEIKVEEGQAVEAHEPLFVIA